MKRFVNACRSKLSCRLLCGASVFLLSVGATAAAAHAQDDSAIETVTVTGFRASLEKALDLKRTALDASDSIMAEDIAKFPDMNVSESLQRIPGVAITRSKEGEGDQISVRGLGAQFTRVRINGMEVLASQSRGRSFDFNVFASELFSNLTVRKSMSASLEEGSLGATVDMHTGHPFDYSGKVFTVMGRFGYHALSKSGEPRVAMLASDVFLGGRVGVLVSAAYSASNMLVAGTSTVRWYNNGYSDDSDGSSSYSYGSVNGETSGDDYDAASEAFHPRFPRYNYLTVHQKRLGVTTSVQWQPDDNTLLSLDGLFADFYQVRDSSCFEANAFSRAGTGSTYTYTNTNTGLENSATTLGVGNINVINFSTDDIDENNTLLHLEATNVGLRTERSLTHNDTRFMQMTLDGTHDFSEKLKTHAMVGWSESHYRVPLSIALTADYGCINSESSDGCTDGGAGTEDDPYIYDYTSGKYPYISYGNVDVTSPDGWFLSQVSISKSLLFNSYRNAVVDAEYDFSDLLQIKAGLDFRNFGHHAVNYSRSNGSTSSMVTTIPDEVRSTDLSEYSSIISLRGVDAPSGTPTKWWSPDITKAIKLFHLTSDSEYSSTGSGNCADGCGAWHLGVEPSVSSNGSVRENDYGGWLETDWNTLFYGIPFRGNIGVRYVLTETTSVGYVYNASSLAAENSTASQTYHDILPSLNMVFEPTETFLIRFNASYAVTRPDLSKMLPGGSVSGSTTTKSVSITNPLLKPTRSKNIDLSYEWYYHKGALISLAGFYKHIDTTVQTIKTDIVYHDNPYGLSDDLAIAACGNDYGSSCNEYLTWTFSVPKNEKGGPLYGAEINLQQPFDFLPAPFNNFGYLGNVTFVQATQNYYNSDGSIRMTGDLEGLSRTSYNSTLYYDDREAFQARVTAAFRSHYAKSMSVSNLNNGTYVSATLNIDASASYKFSDSLMVTFDAINLTNQAWHVYVDKTARRLYEYQKSGRTLYLGVKYTY